ncbi:cyclic nucleotide-gated cation channel beta-1-like [Eucalyptus grandis]|uniref:cyclic nucleotide-gated cation channel beta-1-like n=1 Tax=Eucalyptus grandis TaxID=71139 RepID=UPI00192ED122|nr:cyclic nucleotide-gated cation channel beta-1-like [Eucalyptus grandis]
MYMYRTMVKDKGQLLYSALVTRLFKYLNIQPPKIPCVRTIDPMVVGLKMVSKIRLKELNKALERFKVKTPVKARQDFAAGERKGKEPMIAPSKKRRALILEDEEDDDDITISSFALKNLQSFVTETEDRENRDREETEQRDVEKEAMREEEEEEGRTKDVEKGRERAEEEDHGDSCAEEEGQDLRDIEEEQEQEEYFSPPEGTKTGGAANKRGQRHSNMQESFVTIKKGEIVGENSLILKLTKRFHQSSLKTSRLNY